VVDDRYRTVVHKLDGTTERVSGTPTLNTKRAAEQAERAHVDRVLRPPVAEPVKNEGPMLAAFRERILETYAKANNKPSEQASKRLIMKRHLRPVFGTKRLDQIGRGDIEALKARLLAALSPKTVNNVLAVLGRMLRWAQQAHLGLRWDDVDVRSAKLVVRRSDWNGTEVAPKSGRSRVVPMTEPLRRALSAIRHVRGKRVLTGPEGEHWTIETLRWRLDWLCEAAGDAAYQLHALRHTFCSHLAQRCAPAAAIRRFSDSPGTSPSRRPSATCTSLRAS
jgi:integrase